MPINKHINPYFDTTEQNLSKDLMEEVTQMYGVEIYYLPRVSVNEDDLLGEDTLAYYEKAIPMEAMPTNVDFPWGGQRRYYYKSWY